MEQLTPEIETAAAKKTFDSAFICVTPAFICVSKEFLFNDRHA
jgi:hypothetical protein